jgi:hypothetical protein
MRFSSRCAPSGRKGRCSALRSRVNRKLRLQSTLTRRRRLRLCVFLAFAVALSALAVTKTLPYASSLMANTDVVVEASDPHHGFSIGSVRWEVERFSSAPALAPFRRYFFERCGSRTGTQAAMCLSEAFDRAFPAGTPKHEFFERRFDPVADFEVHLSGQPGYCVNRSAMLATTLLSVGIPARVASFCPRSGWGGHTLVEVWTGADWVVVDPTLVGLVGSIRPNSATELKRRSDALRLFDADGSVRKDPYPLSESIVSGELVYPEPWLYMRTGPRFSFWPFRGKFVQVGMYGWRFSTVLVLCRVAFVISALAGLFFLVGLLSSRGRMETAEPRLIPERKLELKAS